MATSNASATVDMDTYKIQFSDGISSVFRRVDTGSVTVVDGTTVENTCFARSIAYAQAMATMRRPADDEEIAYWVRGLGCKGRQLDVVQKTSVVSGLLGMGVRLRIAFGNGISNVAHALDITRVGDAVVNNEALRCDAVIMHERIGRDSVHYVALIPVEGAATRSPPMAIRNAPAKRPRSAGETPPAEPRMPQLPLPVLRDVLVHAPTSIVACKTFRDVFREDVVAKDAKALKWGLQKSLKYAASEGDIDWCRRLFEQGAISTRRAFENAATTGDQKIVELFIQKGANKWEENGMYGAAEGGHLALVEFFAQKGANDWNEGMLRAARGGHMDLVEFFIHKGATDWYEGMEGAAEGGHLALVEFFVQKGATDYWNEGMLCAARGGHMALVEFFVQKGTNAWTNWNQCMCDAAEGGHLALVEFFMQKGATDWNRGMEYAAKGGHLALVEFFVQKGATNWNWGMYEAAKGGHLALVEFFAQKGANDWNEGMEGAAGGGHMALVEFFVQKGANDWDGGMYGAAEGGHVDLVEFFVQKGATDWNCGMEFAAHNDHLPLVEFFVQKGATRA